MSVHYNVPHPIATMLQLDVVTKVTSLVACNLRVRCPETLALFLHRAAHSVRRSRRDSCSQARRRLRRLIRGLWKNQYCHRDSRKTFSIKFTSLIILHFFSCFFCAKSNRIRWAKAAFLLYMVIILSVFFKKRTKQHLHCPKIKRKTKGTVIFLCKYCFHS